MEPIVDIMFDNPRVASFTRDKFVHLAEALGLSISNPDIELPTTVVQQFLSGLYLLLCEHHLGTTSTDNPYLLLPLLNQMATFASREEWDTQQRMQFECFQLELQKRFRHESWAKRVEALSPDIDAERLHPVRWWKIMTGTGMILFHRLLVRDLMRRDLRNRAAELRVARSTRERRALHTQRMGMATVGSTSENPTDEEPEGGQQSA